MNVYNILGQRRTKIICTLGPASSTEEIIKEMMRMGMNVARLNFSHGNYDTHKQTIQMIRKCAQELDIPFCILQDLQVC
jgi:pyruvate kinase